MSEDNTAVNDVQDTSNTDSATVENDLLDSFEDYGTESSTIESSTSDDSPEEPADEGEQPEPEVEPEAPKETESKEAQKDSSDWDSLDGKSQERFRQLANERNEARRQLQELQARQAQLATEQQLLDQVNPDTGDYYTPEEVARIGAFQRLQAQQAQAEQEAYQLQIRQSQAQLVEDGEKALRDFPMFDANSKDFDPELSALVEPILQANTVTDPNTGEVIGMRVSPYQLLKTYHDALSRNSQKEQTVGRAEAQRATEKMLANVDHVGSASGVTEESDEKKFIEGFFD